MAGLVSFAGAGLTVWIAVGFNANVHPTPFHHHAIIKCRFDSATKRQIRNITGASVIMLAVDPFAFERLGLKLCKFHDPTLSKLAVSFSSSISSKANCWLKSECAIKACSNVNTENLSDTAKGFLFAISNVQCNGCAR